MVNQRPTLIRGASIVTMDENIGDIPNGDILIVDDKIAEIGVNLSVESAEVIDASRMIASPGFVDTHRHVWQAQLKGVAGDWSLFDYTCLMRTMYCICYDAEDAYIGNYLGGLEAVNAGITSIVDHSHLQITAEHSDALVKGLDDSGIRGVFCYGVYRNPKFRPGDVFSAEDIIRETAGPLEAWHRENAERVRSQFFPSDDGRIRFGIASSEYSAVQNGDRVLEEMAWFRTLEPARISVHIGGGVSEKVRVIPLLHDKSMLGEDLLFVHGAHLPDHELALLKDYGGWLSTTPETELQMGMGYPVLERVVASGSTPSLGIDISSNFSGDMFGQMRLMLQTMRFRDYETVWKRIPYEPRFPARKMLEYATMGGARVMGIDHITGSLTPGKKADVILTRMDGVHASPITDPVAALVFYANVKDVDSVWIDGVARKRNGNLVGVTWPTLDDELCKSRDRIFEKFNMIPQKPIREAWAPLWGIPLEPS